MRRRQVKTMREEERPTLLLMAAGAVAGAAAGLYLGRRYRSMDAFLDDMRDRFESLRDVWLHEELSTRRRARVGADVLEDFDEEDLDEDDYEELEEEDLEGGSFVTSDTYENDDEEPFEDEDEDEDEFEDELAAVGRENGVPESVRRADERARRLEERVLQALHDEPVLSARSIELAVVGDGVVELTGSVHTIDEVSRAAALVRGVPGVSMVLNRIEVRAGGTMDTASVAREPREPPAPEERL
jgi:hypothetical protein